MTYFVYLLKSKTSKIYYTGMSQDVMRRLQEHNSGKCTFTKGHLPWELIYFEEVGDAKAARKREKYLKSTAGKLYLRKKGLID